MAALPKSDLGDSCQPPKKYIPTNTPTKNIVGAANTYSTIFSIIIPPTFFQHHGTKRLFTPPPLPERAAFLLSGLFLQCRASRAFSDDFLLSGSVAIRDSLDCVLCFSAITGIAATRSRCRDSRVASLLSRLWKVSSLVGLTISFLKGLGRKERGDAFGAAKRLEFAPDTTPVLPPSAALLSPALFAGLVLFFRAIPIHLLNRENTRVGR